MQTLAQTKIKKLNLSDLINLHAFEAWIRKYIKFYNERKIPGKHMNLFLSYIEDLVRGTDFPHDRQVWFETIKHLQDSLIQNERFKQRHS